MPYIVENKRNRRKARRDINIHQNKFPKAYVSQMDDSRRPVDSLSDLTNMEIVQDNVPRPRPPLVRYGTQPAYTVIGRGKQRYNGTRSLLWMLNVAGVGKLYRQTDGGSYTLLGGTYDDEAWASTVQSKSRCYVYNGVDNLSYIDLTTDTINTYTALTTPGAPTVTKTGMAGTSFTHYYKITANNAVGETIASTAGSVTSGKVRDNWIENTDYNSISWSAVTSATSYTIYYGTSSDSCYELYTVSGNATTSFVDYGTIATNPFKLAPLGNSTQGAIFNWMYVDSKNAQVFGITDDNKLYYSAPGTGDFSPYEGGGWVAIDEGGDTELNFVDGFRNGKGDPVLSVSARGAAGKGKLFHVAFETVTYGETVITYPNVYEANGQSGTYSARAVVRARDSLHYPTGADFKSTGTSQNIVNILTTNTVSQAIEEDLPLIDLSNLHKAVGLEYRDKIYWALPVGSTENNEIWYYDLARKGLWVLRWTVPAKDMWLYEDNDGTTHFCVLSDNKVLEFTRSGATPHQDDDEPFTSRVAFESLVWDEDGLTLGKIRKQYYKLLYPKGTITANTTGLSRNGTETSTGSDSFTVTTTPTGWDDWTYDMYQYDADPGVVNTYGKSVAVLEVRPKGLLAELSWEVVSDTPGTDYILSAVNTKGKALDDLVLKA